MLRADQDYGAASIPTVERNGASVRVMAGTAHGVTGPVFMRNPGMLLDVQLAPGASFREEVRPSSAIASAGCQHDQPMLSPWTSPVQRAACRLGPDLPCTAAACGLDRLLLCV